MESRSRLSRLGEKLVPGRWASTKKQSVPNDPVQAQARVAQATCDDNWQNGLGDLFEVGRWANTGTQAAQDVLDAIEQRLRTHKWRVCFKALQLLDYLLHMDSHTQSYMSTFEWIRNNIENFSSWMPHFYNAHQNERIDKQLSTIKWLVNDELRIHIEREDQQSKWMQRVESTPAPPEDWQLYGGDSEDSYYLRNQDSLAGALGAFSLEELRETGQQASHIPYPGMDAQEPIRLQPSPAYYPNPHYGDMPIPLHSSATYDPANYPKAAQGTRYATQSTRKQVTRGPPRPAKEPIDVRKPIRLDPTPLTDSDFESDYDPEPTLPARLPVQQTNYESMYQHPSTNTLSAGLHLESLRAGPGRAFLGATSNTSIGQPWESSSASPGPSSAAEEAEKDRQWRSLHLETILQALMEVDRMLTWCSATKDFVSRNQNDLSFADWKTQQAWEVAMSSEPYKSGKNLNKAASEVSECLRTINENEHPRTTNRKVGYALSIAADEVNFFYAHFDYILKSTRKGIFFSNRDRKVAWMQEFARANSLSGFDLINSMQKLSMFGDGERSETQSSSIVGAQRILTTTLDIREKAPEFGNLFEQVRELMATERVAVPPPDLPNASTRWQEPAMGFAQQSFGGATTTPPDRPESRSTNPFSKTETNPFRRTASDNIPSKVQEDVYIHDESKLAKFLRIGLSVLTREQLAKYADLFFTIVEGGKPALSKPMAMEFFRQSGLDSHNLDHIWTLADIRNAGELRLPEFALALKLCESTRMGQPLPAFLDQDLKLEILSLGDKTLPENFGEAHRVGRKGNETVPLPAHPQEQSTEHATATSSLRPKHSVWRNFASYPDLDIDLFEYQDLFLRATNGKELATLPVEEVLSILKASNHIDEQMLKNICDLADTRRSGRMYSPEFNLAMNLRDLVLRFGELPPDLPKNVETQFNYMMHHVMTHDITIELPEDGPVYSPVTFVFEKQTSPAQPTPKPQPEVPNETRQVIEQYPTESVESIPELPRVPVISQPVSDREPHVEQEDRQPKPVPSPSSDDSHTITPQQNSPSFESISSPTLQPNRATPTPSLGSNSSRLVSDLVRDSKLETHLSNNGTVVRHISYVSNPRMRQRRLRKEETWRRRQELGTGAFGRVWLEERLDGDGIGKLRAVKEIAKVRPQDRGREIDYNRELEAIAKFSHSKYVHCFVQSFGWFENNHTIFIAMEYIEKGDLQSYLTRPFPEEEVKEIVFQILEGLCFMHENGFAHRDLKPANILVSEPSPNWWVKIGDFGISKRAEEEATAFRTLVGTRGYLAPEVIGIFSPDDMSHNDPLQDSSHLYTVAVDLWALGAIMFMLLTNRDAFDDPRKLARYVTAKLPFPREPASQEGASEACMGFLEKVMGRSPNDRPSSSQALGHKWLSDLRDPEETLENLESLSMNEAPRMDNLTVMVADETIASAQWSTRFG